MGRAVEAGRAVLKLLMDDKELNKKLAGVQRNLRNTGRSIRSTGLQIGGLGAAITAPFALATQKFIQTGDELNKMAARTGVAVKSLSEMKFAAEQSGASLKDVEKAVRTMQRTLLDAEQGTSTATEALGQLGIKLDEIKGQSPEAQFELISKRIAEIEDPSRRAAAAMEIFGRSGQVILPMLGDMEKLRAEARELGITIEEDTAQSAADLADAMNRATKTVVALALQVGAALAPSLIKLANIFQDVVRWTVEFVRNNQKLVTLVAIVGASLITLGATLVTAGGAMAAMAVATNVLTTAIAFLRGGLTLLAAHPIVAALLLVGGVLAWLTDGFGLFSDAVDDAGESLDKVSGIQGDSSFAKKREDVAKATAAVTQRLEQQITASPAQLAQGPTPPNRAQIDTVLGIRQLISVNKGIIQAIESSAFIAGGA